MPQQVRGKAPLYFMPSCPSSLLQSPSGPFANFAQFLPEGVSSYHTAANRSPRHTPCTVLMAGTGDA